MFDAACYADESLMFRMEQRLHDRFSAMSHNLPPAMEGATLQLDALNVDEIDAVFAFDVPPDIARSVPARRRSYAAGRLCARHALHRLGCRRPEVGRHPTGRPVWPQGFVGSIAHTADIAGAVVGRAVDFAGVGMDLERVIEESLAEQVRAQCMVHAERCLMDGLLEPCLGATIVFSAKEAVYKAIAPVLGRFVHFTEVEVVSLDPDRRTLQLRAAQAGDLQQLLRQSRTSYSVHANLVCATNVLMYDALEVTWTK